MRKHKKEFLALLYEVANEYEKVLDSKKMLRYYKAILRYDFEEVKKAFDIAYTKFSRFPMPADIIKIIEDIENPDALAEQAYDKFNKARREIGSYQTVIFDDPIIHRIVELHGGWPAVCAMTKEEEQYTAFKRNFIQEYKAFLTDKDYEYPPKLPGTFEINNSNSGYEEFIPKPVLVGDKVKIARWLAENDRKALERQAREKNEKAVENRIMQLLGYKVALEDEQKRKAV